MVSEKRFMIICIFSFVALADLVVLVIFWNNGDLWTMSALLALTIVTVAGAGAGFMGWFIARTVFNRLLGPIKPTPVRKTAKTMMTEELTVAYDLNIDDMLAFYSHNFRWSRAGRARIFMRYANLTGAIIMLCVAVLVWVFVNEQWLALIIGVMGALMLFYAIFSISFAGKLLKNAVRKEFGQSKNRLIGKHKFSITPTAMTDVTDVGETKTGWGAVEYIATTDRYLFLTVRASGPYIVPKKAFANDEAFKVFAETATAYHQASATQDDETRP